MKNCIHCGRKLERKKYPCGQIENLRRFHERVFCNKNCYYAHRKHVLETDIADKKKKRLAQFVGIDDCLKQKPKQKKSFTQRLKNAFRELMK